MAVPFETLYHAYPHVYRQARRLVKNPEDAEDITQECFLRAWKALPSLIDDNLHAWLFQVVRRCAYDLHRRRVGGGHLTVIPLEMEEPSLVDDGELAEQVSARLSLHRAIAQLAAPARELAALLAQGYSQPEIARHLGLPYETVRKRVARLRALLASVRAEVS